MKFYALWLALLCILMFILQNIIPSFTDALILNKSALSGEVWRFVTSIFLHGSLSHLVFNMFALILFGLILEKVIGSNKFLLVFFSSGIIASVISSFFYTSALGASGAIMGVLGALTILKPKMTVWLYNLPMPMFLAAAVWIVGDIMGVFFPSGVGNIAHLSGIAIGLIFGIVFILRASNNNSNKSYTFKRKINIPEHYMRSWEDNFMR